MITALILIMVGVVWMWLLMAITGAFGRGNPIARSVRSLWVLVLLAGWVVFLYLAVGTFDGLPGAWAWVRGQPVLLQIAMWVFLLPYMVALWIGQLDWALWVRVVLIAFIALSVLGSSSKPPRPKRISAPRKAEHGAW